MKSERKNILFIVPYPVGEAGSQRFRFEQYFDALTENGFDYEVSSFLSMRSWKVLYLKGYIFQKIFAIVSGYFNRIRDLFRLRKFSVVFIHREGSPFGFPWIEYLIIKVFKKKTIFDFDDAIWIATTSESNWITKIFKRNKNAINCMMWATKISAGNKFLADFAKQYNENTTINPTTIDTEEHHNKIKKHEDNKFVIGWTGSHSTVNFLDEVFPVLLELEKKFDFEFHVIADFAPKFEFKSMKFVKWNKTSEIDDLLKFNVGIMPLPDNVWARGKCGFKALQYMSLGIPAVVSDVGVNSEIVEHDVNGCVCKTKEDWILYLSKLMSDRAYLLRLSESARKKIIDNYSVLSNKENFLSLFAV